MKLRIRRAQRNANETAVAKPMEHDEIAIRRDASDKTRKVPEHETDVWKARVKKDARRIFGI